MTCRRARMSVAVLLSATTIAAPMAVRAQAKGQSDRAVTLLMDFALNTIPRQFRQPNGEVITIDRTKRMRSWCPWRRPGRSSRRRPSARAQYCDLPEEQTANFQSMMQRGARLRQMDQAAGSVHHPAACDDSGLPDGHHEGQFQGDGEAGPRSITKGPVWTEPCTDRCAKTSRRGYRPTSARLWPSRPPKVTQPAQRAEPISGTITK